jgi:site-specific DNA-methyltransferase (adenine-specific)
MDNVLYYGDNLDILKRYVKDESVDLVYLDPPFNSNQNYNLLFKERDGSRAASQIRAFKDTWTWGLQDEAVYADLVTAGGKVADVMQAFRTFLGPCDVLAYLVMMAPRLVEMRRVLKPAGSIYLHCDPTASHYLKLLMDAVFGAVMFRSEIVWKRTNARSTRRNWPRLHDIVLQYGRSDTILFNAVSVPGEARKVPHTLVTGEDGLKYQTYELTGPGVTKEGESGKPWRGFDPTSMGRHWANTFSTMNMWDAKGEIHWPKGGGFPRRKAAKPFDPSERMVTVGDVWTDIDRINQSAKELLGYPTQKPEALLERIICASSNEGDLVLDPFCGCGTTIAAAQTLNRRWIGIDVTHLAITLMKERMRDTFGESVQFKVVGEPVSVPDAAALAASDPYQFQWWALGLVGARPVEGKKGADKGIDGKIVFQSDGAGKFDTVIFSVKAGHVTVNQVRDLRGVVEREKAVIGVLISMQDPTKPMQTEAVTAGFYESPMWNRKYPRIQLLTIAGLLAGKQIEMPPVRQVGATFKKAPKASGKGFETRELPGCEYGE